VPILCALRSASTGVELCAAATNLLFAAPPAVAGPGTTHDNPNGPWRSAPSRRTPGASSVIARAQAGGTVRRPRWHGLCEQTLSAARVRTPGLTMTLGSWPDGGARKHELRTSRGCAAAPTLGCQSRSRHPRTSEQTSTAVPCGHGRLSRRGDGVREPQCARLRPTESHRSGGRRDTPGRRLLTPSRRAHSARPRPLRRARCARRRTIIK
jgi:hypothetical protein